MRRLTVAQVRRRRCFRCKRRRGYAVWSICADGNRPRAICKVCDVSLNRLVVRWAGFPNAVAMMARYAALVEHAA
jgi:hypothetical protein